MPNLHCLYPHFLTRYNIPIEPDQISHLKEGKQSQSKHNKKRKILQYPMPMQLTKVYTLTLAIVVAMSSLTSCFFLPWTEFGRKKYYGVNSSPNDNDDDNSSSDVDLSSPDAISLGLIGQCYSNSNILCSVIMDTSSQYGVNSDLKSIERSFMPSQTAIILLIMMFLFSIFVSFYIIVSIITKPNSPDLDIFFIQLLFLSSVFLATAPVIYALETPASLDTLCAGFYLSLFAGSLASIGSLYLLNSHSEYLQKKKMRKESRKRKQISSAVSIPNGKSDLESPINSDVRVYSTF